MAEDTDAEHAATERRDFWVLALGTLGIVYGDIGTSPIYAIRESLHLSHGVEVTRDNTLGILSLIFWSLIIVITIKYLVLVMKADNRGEGGIIALTALVAPPSSTRNGRRWYLVMLGLFGAALLYGDSMITPAISVLSAVEGLEVATPVLRPYVIPITVGILVALFSVQRHGTARVGAIFGPVTLTWFIVLAILGIRQIVSHPGVLVALNPLYAARFFGHNGWNGFLALGSVFLVVTGGEALYADMGHFGKGPIRLTWATVVFPALTLNYFGQGALVINDPSAAAHPFFLMAPGWALLPLVGLATAATVIASQAVISGAFSLTRQAVQLGYLPRLKIEHTSKKKIGQIYLPAVNWALMIACIGLVLGFRSSERLAAAYGVAVTTDMVFTTLLFATVALVRWKWSLWTTGLLTVSLLIVDLAFWGANLPKIPHGGWFPLVVAFLVFILMTTWKKGRETVSRRLGETKLSPQDFIQSLEVSPPKRVEGTAIFMSAVPEGVPRGLLHNLKHNRVLHERVLFLTVLTTDAPNVSDAERVEVQHLGEGFDRVIGRYGFAEDPNVPELLGLVEIDDWEYKQMETTFFFGEVSFIISEKSGLGRWRAVLFDRMVRNARRAASFFGIPPNRVVGLGVQIEL